MNEHIAREANTEDKCTGHFWATLLHPCSRGICTSLCGRNRYESQALLDEAALFASMAYVDLNPIRAKLAETPEDSEFTSLYARIRKLGIKSSSNKILASKSPSSTPTPKGLMPFAGAEHMDTPQNALPFDFRDYLALVDWTGRAVREDKRGAIPDNLSPILVRLGIEPQNWFESVNQFEQNYHRVMGPIDRVRDYAATVGMKWYQGLSRCAAFYRASPA